MPLLDPLKGKAINGDVLKSETERLRREQGWDDNCSLLDYFQKHRRKSLDDIAAMAERDFTPKQAMQALKLWHQMMSDDHKGCMVRCVAQAPHLAAHVLSFECGLPDDLRAALRAVVNEAFG